MESKARFLGHPVHQMLIVFPLGLLVASVVFDLIHLASDSDDLAIVSFYMIVGGIVGGLVAAPFGTIDWLAIPHGTRAKSIGAVHGAGNVVVLLLFIGSWLLRLGDPEDPQTPAIILSLAGVALSLVTAWLGGELVSRLGVGVADGAHLDAPNSLRSDRKASAPDHAPR